MLFGNGGHGGWGCGTLDILQAADGCIFDEMEIERPMGPRPNLNLCTNFYGHYAVNTGLVLGRLHQSKEQVMHSRMQALLKYLLPQEAWVREGGSDGGIAQPGTVGREFIEVQGLSPRADIGLMVERLQSLVMEEGRLDSVNPG